MLRWPFIANAMPPIPILSPEMMYAPDTIIVLVSMLTPARVGIVRMNKQHQLTTTYLRKVGITQLLQDPMAKIYQRMTSYKLITRVILILFHLKFQNTGSISIPVRSLLQGRQTSYWSHCSKIVTSAHLQFLC